MKIKTRSPKQIKSLYEKIKTQKKEAGERFNQSEFMALLGYNKDGALLRKWIRGDQSPSTQCLILMEIIEGNTEVIQSLQLLKPLQKE